MQSLKSDASAPARRSRLTLWLIVAVCAAPVIASYIAFYWLQPSGHVNYGELIEPAKIRDAQLQTLDGAPFQWSDVKGEWVLLTVADATCDETCRTNLIYMRQVRLAQGNETERIERVWLLSDGGLPDPALLAQHPGLRVLRARAGGVALMLPGTMSLRDRIYVVDPLGNLMMRFPQQPDPRRILKDLSRLLRHSKWR